MRASFEIPKTSLFGMYAMAICERGGTARRKWPSHRDRGGTYRANWGELVSSGGRTLPVNGTK